MCYKQVINNLSTATTTIIMLQMDTLLNHHHDAMVSVLGNLDARMLLQLERVSKSFQRNIRSNGVLRTGVLNSFHGISNVPEVADYEVYVHILKYHYDMGYKCYSAACWHNHMFISLEYAQYHLSHLGDDGFRLLNSLEFDAIIANFYERTIRAFKTLKGRKIVLQYTEKWKAEWKSRPISLVPIENIDHYKSTEAIIDRILAIASSEFCFYSSGDDKKLFPHGMIDTNEELIPEVLRHRNATAAFLQNPTIQNPMNYILSRMKYVRNLLLTRFKDFEEDVENDDEEDSDDEEDVEDDDEKENSDDEEEDDDEEDDADEEEALV
jgi:hypothetical protein